MNICPNCGSNLKDGDKFCRKCGTKVELRNNDFLGTENTDLH